MRRLWAGGFALSLGWLTANASAEELDWRPTAAPPAATRAVGLGRPVPLDDAEALSGRVVRGQMPDAPRPVSASLGTPVPSGGPHVVRVNSEDAYNNGMIPAAGVSPVAPPTIAGAPPAPPPPPPPVGMPPPGPPGTALPPGLANSAGGPAGDNLFGCESLGCTCGSGRQWFQSDHCFDNFISPVSNPFLFEDPRSLTEIRPIFIYQHTPSSNYLFNGGSVGFFGTQARLALTDRLSFVVNKLGFVWVDPKGPTTLSSDTSFGELDLGPKFTFLRNENTGTLGAAGVTFQIPTGSSKTFQDTGSLTLVPYVSFGQTFGQTSYGAFNALATTGYALSVDNKRSDYFYLSTHLDFDVANLHKIYPLIELNWFHYATSGQSVPFGFEGRDLINFGSTGVSGLDSLTIAVGGRYKFCESVQTGMAVEFPLTTSRDLVNFRFTWDVILRY